MDNQLTINDLPVECIDEILKNITDCEHRIYARFVCKLWCALIDQDCSAEKYLIYCEEMYRNRIYRFGLIHDVKLLVDFSKIISIFLNSQRNKTSFYFNAVNFQGSEQFWRTKGAGIILLHLGFSSRNIPLSEIIEYCSKLKSLTLAIPPYGMSKEEFIEMLEDCISNGKRNYAVRFLHLNHRRLVNINDIANFTRLISQIFVGVQKVYLDVLSSDYYKNNHFDQPDNVELFSTAFQNLTFEINLKFFEGTFVFDPAGNVPVRMTNLMIDRTLQSIDEILTHLSRYSCDSNHLNTLDFLMMNGHSKLDDVQKLISQWPSLKSLRITIDSDRFIPLTNPFGLNKNNINHLSISPSIYSHPAQMWAIDGTFLQFFENLRSFNCYCDMVFSDFVKLLRELPHLKKLYILKGSIDVDPVQTISNEKLLELTIPYSFLCKTIVKYDFINLSELHLYRESIDEIQNLHPNNVDRDLSRMNCPKLEILNLGFPIQDCWQNHDEVAQWILNILALYPSLIKFLSRGDYTKRKDDFPVKAADEILKTILKKHRRLREISCANVWHIRLKILSPSHIKRYYYRRYGDPVIISVLNVP